MPPIELGISDIADWVSAVLGTWLPSNHISDAPLLLEPDEDQSSCFAGCSGMGSLFWWRVDGDPVSASYPLPLEKQRELTVLSFLLCSFSSSSYHITQHEATTSRVHPPFPGKLLWTQLHRWGQRLLPHWFQNHPGTMRINSHRILKNGDNYARQCTWRQR